MSVLCHFVQEDDDHEIDGPAWARFLASWLDRVPANGRFSEVFGEVTTLDNLTAADYAICGRS